jgi:hypothetical protein
MHLLLEKEREVCTYQTIYMRTDPDSALNASPPVPGLEKTVSIKRIDGSTHRARNKILERPLVSITLTYPVVKLQSRTLIDLENL